MNSQLQCQICCNKENINKYLNDLLCKNCYQNNKEILYEKQKKQKLIFPEFNKITHRIYIGNSDSARDFKILKEAGITHILVLGSYLFTYFPNDFIYKVIEVEDDDDEDISLYFKEAFEIISSAEKILVHCYAGACRSVSFVIAYLMLRDKKSYISLYSYVKNRRPAVNINNGFKKILLNFEMFLKKKNYIIGEDCKLSKEYLETEALME
jgi:hypothetical protein